MTRYKYRLRVDISHRVALPGPDFNNAWLSIIPANGGTATWVTVRTGYAWDGATAVPDFRWAVDASCFHDALYQYAEDIAAANRWSVRAVLRWADYVFLDRMQDDGGRFGAFVYFLGVRLFGYAYHMLARELCGPAQLRRKARSE